MEKLYTKGLYKERGYKEGLNRERLQKKNYTI